MIGSLFQQLYNLTDSLLCGYYLGFEATGAIGSTTSLYVTFVGLVIGLNSGYSIVIARLYGKGDTEAIRAATACVLAFNIVISIVLVVTARFAAKPILTLLKTPKDIADSAHGYIAIVLGGLAFSVFYNMFSGIMMALGNSKAPLVVLAISCLLNIVATYAALHLTDFGINGAAYTTVLSQLLSAVLCFLYSLKKYRRYLRFVQAPKLYVTRQSLLMLSTGLSVGLMNSVVALGSVFIQGAVNSFGTAVVTGFTTARRVFIIMSQPFISVAIAIATFTSQNYGAGKTKRIDSALKSVLLLCVAWSAVSFCVMFFFGEPLSQLLTGTTEREVLDISAYTLRLIAPFMLFYGVLCVMRNTLQSVGDRLSPALSGLLELVLKLVCSYALVNIAGYTAVSLAEPVIWVVLSLGLLVVFFVRKGRRSRS